jgi:hypothetical protein
MFYLLFPFLIPILTILLFPVLANLIASQKYRKNIYLYLAAFSYFLSWYLPSPLINGQNTSFTTHVVGGGFFSCLLILSFIKSQNHKLNLFQEFLTFFAFTSSLGTLNELFELFLVQFHLVKKLNITDTSWDLLANSFGCLIFYLVYFILKSKFFSQKHV